MKITAVLILSAAVVAAQTKPAPAKPPAAKPAAAKSKVAPAARSAKPAAAATAAASKDGKVVMKIGSETVTEAEFEALIEALPENARAQARGPMKRQLAEQVVRVKLLAAEARRKGLDKDPGLQARMQFQIENMLAGAVYTDITKGTNVDAAAISKYYDEHKNEYEQASARHILIKYKGSPVPQRSGKPELSEEQALAKAQDLRKRLQAGEDFAKIAKEESDDTGSGGNGGDLGSFGRGQMVPEFDKAVFTQPVNEISEPIKTQFGYHIIQVTKRDSKSLDEMKGEIESRLRPERAREAVEALRKTAQVTMDDSYFGPENPPAPASPAGEAPANPAPAPPK